MGVAEQTERTEEATATMNRDKNGNPLGCAIFLDAGSLEALGIDLDDTFEVNFWVDDGALHVASN